MDKYQAAGILNRYPGLIAFDPQSPDLPAEICMEGWFCPEAIQAIAWWMQHCPTESWWHEHSDDPFRGLSDPEASSPAA